MSTLKLSLFCLFMLILQGNWMYAQNLDISILKDIHLKRNHGWDPFFRHLSNSVLPLTLAIPIGVYGYEKGISNTADAKRRGTEMLAVAMATVALSQSLKWTLNRPRPYEKYTYLQPVYLADDPSFPSGHTASAFALATSATLIWPKWYVGIPAYVWAGSVGYSRMHLGLHYPSDVLAGALLGTGTAYLGHYLNKKWFRPKVQKQEVLF